MQLPVPELLPMAQLYTGAQQGIDDKGALAVAVFPGDEEGSWGSMFAVFVPVTDYKAFVEQLLPDDATAEYCEVTIFGQTYLATQKGGFAVLASADGKPLLEKIKGSSKGVADALAPLKPWITKQQLAVAITPAGKKLLTEALSGFLDAAIEGAEQAGTDGNDADTPSAAEAIQSVGDTMRAVKDLLTASDDQVTQLGIGLQIDDTTALHLSGRLLFAANGGLSQWAQEVKRPQAGLLAGLPPGKFALAYGGTSIQFHPAVAKVFQQVTQAGMTTLGLSEEDRKKLADVMERQNANQISSAALLGQLRPGDSIVSTSIQIQHVKDATEQMKTSREMFELLTKTRIPGSDPPKAIYSLDDVTVGDLKTLELTMDMESMMVGRWR